MSDEESFVILGSSPMSSLENDGMEARKPTLDTSLESDSPGSQFTSLKSSQIRDLTSVTEDYFKVHPAVPDMAKQTKLRNTSTPLTQSLNQEEVKENNENNAASKLWSVTPQEKVKKNMELGLEDCALKSPLEQQQQKPTAITEQGANIKPTCAVDGSLAASFIMGEINSDILKTSVYSQFPSISLEASAEEVVKLQNMVTEYSQLKSMIKKANNTMKLFYQNSLQWKEKMQKLEEDYTKQLNDCKKEIVELRKQNDEMDKNFQTQIEALEIARKKDREEYIQEISEKSSILENMRAQIIKLEQQQLASFDIILTDAEKQKVDKVFAPQLENELKIKDLQKQMSELLASNLDLKDIEKQYLAELSCLKVNLVAAEELAAKNRNDIIQLESSNTEKDQEIKSLNASLKALHLAFEEQKERIALLEAQNQLHRADFEIEKQSREAAVKEKQQMLQDLRLLQKRNQELIEEQQKLADNYQKKISSTAATNGASVNAASAAAQIYMNNPQRNIQVPLSNTTPATSPPNSLNMCPICNKGFKTLSILLSHVDDCVDKN